jgi:hypothetical protein
MMTPLDAVEWALYTFDAMLARWRVDTNYAAKCLAKQIPY